MVGHIGVPEGCRLDRVIFRNVITAQDNVSYAQGHDDEADTEYRINLADYLVDGNKVAMK